MWLATIGGKFAPLIGLRDENMDIKTMITTYNTTVTEAASEILGKESRRKKQMFLTSMMRGEIIRRSGFEAEGAKSKGKQTKGFRMQ